MKLSIHLLLAAVALALSPVCAWALELKDYSVSADGKKIAMSFSFSAAVKEADFKVVSNYQGNFVALRIAGLKFNRQQLKTDIPPKDKDLLLFYRFVRFCVQDDAGEVRVYLAKPVNPADVLVELREAKAGLEIVKPWWKLPGAQPPADTAGDEAGFIPDAPVQPDEQPATALPPDNLDELPPPGEGFREVGDPPADGTPAETAGWGETPGPAPEESAPPAESAAPAAEPDAPAAAQPPAEEAANGGRPNTGETYNQTGVGELFGPGSGAKQQNPPLPPVKPAPAPRNGPGYTEFDLDQIPISGIEIRGLPFDEALLKLVASSGFNVIVGKDVDSTEVNLNFTQKQISLKNALDLLCIAYDLSYTIEADAIVIKGKN